VPLVGDRGQEPVTFGSQLIAAPPFRIEESFKHVHTARLRGKTGDGDAGLPHFTIKVSNAGLEEIEQCTSIPGRLCRCDRACLVVIGVNGCAWGLASERSQCELKRSSSITAVYAVMLLRQTVICPVARGQTAGKQRVAMRGCCVLCLLRWANPGSPMKSG
jgi:hypothetical protein